MGSQTPILIRWQFSEDDVPKSRVPDFLACFMGVIVCLINLQMQWGTA